MNSEEKNTRYRGIICGLGRIASLLEDDQLREKPATHAGAMAAHPRIHLWGGVDTSAERRELFEKRWPGTQAFDSLKALLKEVQPDFAVIATWPDTHFPLMKALVRAGVGLIVCEKPLAPHGFSAQKAADYCRRKGVVLMVNHERRFSLDYQWVRTKIQEGWGGRLLSLHGTVFMGKNRTPGEVLLWDGTHMLDILRYLSGGELEKIRSRGNRNERGSSLFAEFLAGGIPTFLEVGCGRDYLQFEVDLSFEKGRILIGNGTLQIWNSQPSPFYEKMRSLVPGHAPQFPLTGYFSRMMEDVVRVLDEGKTAKPLSSGHDGWRALRAIDQISRRARRF